VNDRPPGSINASRGRPATPGWRMRAGALPIHWPIVQSDTARENAVCRGCRPGQSSRHRPGSTATPYALAFYKFFLRRLVCLDPMSRDGAGRPVLTFALTLAKRPMIKLVHSLARPTHRTPRRARQRRRGRGSVRGRYTTTHSASTTCALSAPTDGVFWSF
jgi:hypothetical protein